MSTNAEKIMAQKMAFEEQPSRPWHRHIIGPSEIEAILKQSNERDKRLAAAEDILSELSSGYWVSILNDNDDPVKVRLGQRALDYWRTIENSP